MGNQTSASTVQSPESKLLAEAFDVLMEQERLNACDLVGLEGCKFDYILRREELKDAWGELCWPTGQYSCPCCDKKMGTLGYNDLVQIRHYFLCREKEIVQQGNCEKFCQNFTF